mgnify:CR=1 FL=1
MRDHTMSTLHRRAFLCIAATSAFLGAPARRKFVFKIRTKSGGIIGNILIEAKDMFAAIAKLKKRYPGCEILEAREK